MDNKQIIDKFPVNLEGKQKPIPKSKLPLVVLAGVLTLIIASSVYIFSPKQTKPTVKTSPIAATKPSPTPDQTANWKLYTNTKYSFSLNYPPSLNVKEDLKNKFIHFNSDYKPPFYNYLDITIYIHDNSKTDLKTWLDQYVIKNLPTGKKGSIVKDKVINYKNNEINGFSFIGGVESENRYVFFKKDDVILEFRLSGSGTGGSYKENKNGEKNLDQILSTFKFLDQNQAADTSNWKIYENKKYSYSFKYPPLKPIDIHGKESTVIIQSDNNGAPGLPYFYINVFAPNQDYYSAPSYNRPDKGIITFLNAKKEDIIESNATKLVRLDNVTINNETAFLFESTGAGPYTTIHDRRIILQKGDSTYMIGTYYQKTNDISFKYFQQILSTFKFTK